MNNFLKAGNPFDRARRNLTIFYCGILLIILTAFSASLYTVQMGTISRVVIQREFGSRPPRLLTLDEVYEFREQAVTLRNSLIWNLVLIDLTILFAGTFLSYILAGKTLEPIKKTLDSQKNFIADASHELRTPLTAIISAAEVALRSHNKTREDYQKVLKQVHTVGNDMSLIVNELLTISKLGTTPYLGQKTNINLKVLLDQSLSQIRPMAENKDIEINVLKSEKVEVMGNPNKLKQLMIILLDNALKYNKKGGKVNISLINSPKKTLIIEDTGVGIEDEDLGNIFKRFYRGDKSRSTPGAGLGLSIAEDIALKHKAAIEVKSRVGKGSVFSVVFS